MASEYSLTVQGVTLTVSCEVPHTFSEGFEYHWVLMFGTPVWSVTTSGAGFSNTETYQQDEYGMEPSVLVMLQDAKDFLEEKINHADTTRAQATVLMTAVAEMEESQQIESAFGGYVNLAFVSLQTEVDALLAQVDRMYPIYALGNDAPTASITDTAQAIVNAQLNRSTPVALSAVASVVAALEE